MPSTVHRLLAISPHLDDAVFACGEVLCAHPGARVATLFAGAARRYATLPPWDRDAGFVDGEDVMQRRRAEDRAALGLLGARPHWLDFRDRQYLAEDERPDRDGLECAIDALVRAFSPERVLAPLGLFHSDHMLAGDAVLTVAVRYPRVQWTAYEDALYRRLPGLVQQRLAAIHARGWHATPVALPAGHLERKRAAVECYASQLRALNTAQRPTHADAFARERYWDLAYAPVSVGA
jgi:LmbE family N-acetylglucosaminyl deacetylase